MATDGRRLFWFPPFVASLSPAELAGVLAHETYHCAALHMTRRGRRDPDLWNIAADYAINRDLVFGSGMSLPPGALLSSDYHGLSAEEIYNVLSREADKAAEDAAKAEESTQGDSGEDAGDDPSEDGTADDSAAPGQAKADAGDDDAPGTGTAAGDAPDDATDAGSGPGDDDSGEDAGDAGNGPGEDAGEGEADGPGEGAGEDAGEGEGASESAAPPSRSGGAGAAPPSGRSADRGRCGGVIDAADSEGEAETIAAEWGAKVRQAAAVAIAAGAGRLPAGIAELVESLDRPRIDWRAEMRRFIDQAARQDYSFARPSRRFPGASFVMPGLVPDGISHLVAIVDTSLSITRRELDAFAAELDSAFGDGGADRLTVIFCDDDVRHVQEFQAGDTVRLESHGGGFTDFAPAFAYIAENIPDASAIVYLTDLECRSFGIEPAAPVLWACYGDSRNFPRLAAACPFGEALHISPD